MMSDHDYGGHHEGHDHEGHGHEGHGHGHENDQGLKGALRYLRWAPSMWKSEINTAVIALVAPTEGEQCIDIGAGVGAGAVVAARTGATVMAAEPTPFLRRVLVGRRWLQRHRIVLNVVDGTAESLPVADASIDAIWAVNTMHHWLSLEQGVAEIARVLRPGGRMVLVDESFLDPTHPEYKRFAADSDGDHHHGFTMVGAEQMRGLFAAAGLEGVETSNRQLAGRPVIAVTLTAWPS